MSLLDIVSTEDEQFKENYPKIMKKVERKKLEEIEPTIDEITKVFTIITNFIKKKKRKVYGGYALNKLLIAKNPNLAIYDLMDTPDIEFYSPEPLDDLIGLCDILHDAGFKNVVGQEAQHKETYSLFVNFQLYCDISYMPANLYNKTRYIQSDEFNLVHPWFMTIDFFRMFTNPMVSYWRLEKHFARYLKLQKTYPLPLINKPVQMDYFKNDEFNEVIELIEDFLSSRPNIILTGFYVYNYYQIYSNYSNKDSRFRQIQIPYLEAYSSDYITDGLDLIEQIKVSFPPNLSSKILHKEFYPFFQFYGYNTVFYFKDGDDEIPILYLYSNNKKCIPFKNVPYIKFDNINLTFNRDNGGKDLKTINIGSFDFNILHALIILVKVRVDSDDDWNNILYTLINGYVAFRKHYFNENKKTLYDDTIFEGFVIDCKGETILPERERRILMNVRKKLGKPAIYRYEPGVSKQPSQYYFANSSGNQIKNDKNLKLTENNLGKKYEDIIEAEELDKIKPKDTKTNNSETNDSETKETESNDS
jgi:hypothetical protein